MIKSIPAEVAKELVKEGRILVLDVRTPMENAHERIKDSVLIPLNELDSRAQEVPRDRPILVYCRSGSRSMTASRILANHGFQEIYNLPGGINECPFECLEE